MRIRGAGFMLAIVLVAGCVRAVTMERLPLPECPKDYAELVKGWIGDEAQGFQRPLSWEIHRKDGKVEKLRVWMITVEDRRALELWVVKLLTCAKARGAVIQEVNR
jgi:hypothetical protein